MLLRIGNRAINPDQIVFVSYDERSCTATVHYTNGGVSEFGSDEAEAVWNYFTQAEMDLVERYKQLRQIEEERQRQLAELEKQYEVPF